MVIIRLQRVGRKNDPSFRLVATDSRNAARSGSFLEILGSYDPRSKKKALNGERIKFWILKGAQLSVTVHNILAGEKIIDAAKISKVPAPKVKTAAEGEAEAVKS
ncbi:30S ribosomal protein S16 [Candidatus Giovannonibacteria bacterium]|nr:30S ribosomal protein S16 [Candidatus Giovannonibacteria bacterium]